MQWVDMTDHNDPNTHSFKGGKPVCNCLCKECNEPGGVCICPRCDVDACGLHDRKWKGYR